ncbi:MAG: cysteine hydrolase [Proteobacteria bacterium]|nr:MAG: cysteine hydrolase [Pseudomonadota bacterium]
MTTLSRRGVIAGVAGAATAAALTGTASAATGGDYASAVPELAPQWKQLDLAKILQKPAAFISVSQNNSLYKPWGAQAAEKQWERGSLPATVKAAQAARKAPNFVSFSWIGYEVFRENYPQTEFDKVQYASWTANSKLTPEQRKADNDLVDDLRALVRPGDLEFNELAFQTAFVGTQLPLELARKRVEVLVITGIHTEWCIEGNARAARDHGYLPIVIGDATATQKPDYLRPALERINNIFAPVISADTFTKLLGQPA